MSRFRNLAGLLLATASLTLAGCVTVATGSVGNPYPAPPPAQVEMMPKPPVSDQAQIWQPGHWDWTGGGYAWTAGMWIPQAGHGPNWQEGYWSNPTGVWMWNPARWIRG